MSFEFLFYFSNVFFRVNLLIVVSFASSRCFVRSYRLDLIVVTFFFVVSKHIDSENKKPFDFRSLSLSPPTPQPLPPPLSSPSPTLSRRRRRRRSLFGIARMVVSFCHHCLNYRYAHRTVADKESPNDSPMILGWTVYFFSILFFFWFVFVFCLVSDQSENRKKIIILKLLEFSLQMNWLNSFFLIVFYPFYFLLLKIEIPRNLTDFWFFLGEHVVHSSKVVG